MHQNKLKSTPLKLNANAFCTLMVLRNKVVKKTYRNQKVFLPKDASNAPPLKNDSIRVSRVNYGTTLNNERKKLHSLMDFVLKN